MNRDMKGHIANYSTVVKVEDVERVIQERWERGQYCWQQFPMVEKDGSEDKHVLMYFRDKNEKGGIES